MFTQNLSIMNAKYLIPILVVLLCGFTTKNLSSGAGNETLIEMIETTESVPVYLMPGALSVRKPTTTGLLPASCNAISIADEELGNSYDGVLQTVVNELNKTFGTDKFTAGDLATIPTKTVTVMGNTGVIQDWSNSSDKIIVLLSITGTYTFFPGDGVVKTTYTVAGNAKFAEITNAQQPLKYVNAFGSGFGASSDFEIEGDCYSEMSEYKEKVDPNSLVEDLSGQVSGAFTRFYEKEKKKYDKAMKKKK